jgi:LysR family glycine cleavage system transcriptional activator
LLGATDQWSQFLAQCGCVLRGRTVAEFNDAGLMLQAAEHDLGIALAREVLARDALQAGRLVRLSPHQLALPDDTGYWILWPPELAGWGPLLSLRRWLAEQAGAAPDPTASGAGVVS